MENISRLRDQLIIRYLVIAVAIVIILISIVFFIKMIPTGQRMYFNISIDRGGNTIFLHHLGGDPLDREMIYITLNDHPVPLNDITLENSQDWPWSIGKTIIITSEAPEEEEKVQIFYGSGTGIQIFSGFIQPVIQSAGESVITTTIPVTDVSPTSTTHQSTPTLTLIFTPTTTPIPGIPVASFNATPRSGPVPLPVQFRDTSTGIPDEWFWTFGDGGVSTVQDPLHTYLEVGSYQVGLAVKNEFGGHTRIGQGFITVTPAEERDIFLEASRGAVIPRGGFIEFSVNGPGARVKIGGTTVDLPDGSRVRLTLDGPSRGKIAIRDGSISLFMFDKVVLSIDGIERAAGSAQEIVVPGYERLISSLNLEVDSGKGPVRILEGGLPAPVHPGDSPLLLVSLRPDPAGVLTLDCYREERSVFQGAVSSYSVL